MDVDADALQQPPVLQHPARSAYGVPDDGVCAEEQALEIMDDGIASVRPETVEPGPHDGAIVQVSFVANISEEGVLRRGRERVLEDLPPRNWIDRQCALPGQVAHDLVVRPLVRVVPVAQY